jgi:NAD(P)-dependent dehydrogenase (short-subunit alcohol dehydrogenase family)
MTQPLLQDRVVVIVGGTTGMGLSAAQACLAEGARVVSVGRHGDSAAAARATLGERARVLTGDACDPHTADAAIQHALAEFGRFDALYHVAGGSGRKFGDGPLHALTDEGWQYTLDLNLTSLFNSNRAAVRQFLKQGGSGSILNLGSVLGQSPSPQNFATHAYAAAKSAAVGFTRAIAAYYAPRNIRVNLLVPALVETPMSARATGDAELMDFVKLKQPLDGGRIGQPGDLDAAVVYFLSDASKFVTGQVLRIDGGWSLSEGNERRF